MYNRHTPSNTYSRLGRQRQQRRRQHHRNRLQFWESHAGTRTGRITRFVPGKFTTKHSQNRPPSPISYGTMGGGSGAVLGPNKRNRDVENLINIVSAENRNTRYIDHRGVLISLPELEDELDALYREGRNFYADY